jgi:hypothetical protein
MAKRYTRRRRQPRFVSLLIVAAHGVIPAFFAKFTVVHWARAMDAVKLSFNI